MAAPLRSRSPRPGAEPALRDRAGATTGTRRAPRLRLPDEGPGPGGDTLASGGPPVARPSETPPPARRSEATSLPRPGGHPSGEPTATTEAHPHHQLDLALTDLAEVLAVYPYRAAMPACPHCVSDADLRALGRQPELIPADVLDRYVTKCLITWGEEVDLKRLLPEILARLVAGRLGPPDALVGARLRRAGWLAWPAAETPAVRRTLRATWFTTLAGAPGEGRPPASRTLALIASAEDDLVPYLDLWEDRLVAPGSPTARLAAVLHLADLLAPLASGGRRRLARTVPLARRSVVGQLDHWLRQPIVVQRLARAADALSGTEHELALVRARQGLARLRTEG